MAENVAFTIRAPRATDQAYVASTWRSSLLSTGRGTWAAVNAVVDRLLDDPRTKLLLAARLGEVDRILGWIAYVPMPSKRLLHYVYVRDAFRRQGIARVLVGGAFGGRSGPVFYTLEGPSADWLLARYADSIRVPAQEIES